MLIEVKLRELGSCRVFLKMHHESRSYIGVLFFDDQPFCLRVYEFLKPCVGMGIQEIGELEFEKE